MVETDSHELEVLLVDDDPEAGPLLADLLRRRGYAVVRCADGCEALGHLEAGAVPDVILLDVRMPLMDGLAFRTAQRRDPRLRGIPVIAIGNPAYWELRRLAPDAFIARPFRVAAVVEAIAELRRPVAAGARRAHDAAALRSSTTST